MLTEAASSIPEQGQAVVVRQRRYIVSDVQAGALPEVSISERGLTQHLASLDSIDDDGYGENLQVLWEIEPGARVFERVELPEPHGFDAPDRLDAFLNAVQWGVVASADMRALQAPFRSGIEIEDRQLDPLVRAAHMARVNLLIADDVGLGKTVEAGMVIQELLVHDFERDRLSFNAGALAARLQRIPDEINAELDAIRRRYADPTPRLFPVAVTFVVPERLA